MTDDWRRHPAVVALRRDLGCGASELGRQALEDLAAFAEHEEAEGREHLVGRVEGLATELAKARPGMPSIATLIGRWRREIESDAEETIARLRERLAARSRALAEESLAAVEAVAREVAALVPPGSTVITISRSSTVVRALARLEPRGRAPRDLRVIVCESRPRCEGHQLAKELDEARIETQIITEAQAGLHMRGVDLALVGADAVLADGSVVNKAGTYLLALAAREADVPFWVCCESFKRSDLEPAGFPLEEMDPEMLGAPALEHGRVRNVAFDVTPARLVTRWIDERGSTLAGPRSAEPVR